VGQVVGIVREVRGVEGSAPRVVISGRDPEDLAAALAAGGERGAVAVDGNPAAAAIAVRLVDGDPDERERRVLRQLMREPTPLVVVRRGGSARIPHVLADDVVDLEVEGITGVAEAIARAAGADGPGLAARLPVLRAPVAARLVSHTAFANAVLAASSRAVPQLPLLTLAQARMLLLLGVARGDVLPRDPEGLLRAAGPSLVAALGTGLGARALVRRLPLGGPIVRAAIAYGGTRALGTALRRL
jgi:uncharacterized protein (DUF697 family)